MCIRDRLCDLLNTGCRLFEFIRVAHLFLKGRGELVIAGSESGDRRFVVGLSERFNSRKGVDIGDQAVHQLLIAQLGDPCISREQFVCACLLYTSRCV